MNKLLVLALVVGVFGGKNGNNGKAVGNPNNGNNGNDNGRGNAGGHPGNNGGDNHGSDGGHPGNNGGDNHGSDGGHPGNSGGDNHGSDGGHPGNNGGDNHGSDGGHPGNSGGDNHGSNPGVPVVPHPVTPPPAAHSTGLPLWETMFIAEHIIAGHTDNRSPVPWCSIGKPLRDEFNNHIYCGRRFVDCPLGSQCVHGEAVDIAMCCPSEKSVASAVSVPTVILPTVFIAKCPVGSPWKDVNGLEFYCGPPAFGMEQVNCPLGSRCETPENNAYFACCSV